MKKTMRKAMLLIAFTGLLAVGTISKVSAKFWGWKVTATTDWADGICAYRETCKIHYIFWIAGEEQCVTSTIACID